MEALISSHHPATNSVYAPALLSKDLESQLEAGSFLHLSCEEPVFEAIRGRLASLDANGMQTPA
ncbi:MAG: hypothetical protein AAGC68_14755 [Verrucomicrobiota bacterium]